MKRLLSILFIGIWGFSALAQKNTYEGFDIYGLDANPENPKWTYGIEIGVGTGVNASVRLQRNFGDYFAWDALQLTYAYDYTNVNEEDFWYHWDKIPNVRMFSLTTGFRVFTPAFTQKSHLKSYLSAAYGYGFDSRMYYDLVDGEQRVRTHNNAFDCSIGLQYRNFHLGYGFNLHASMKESHYDYTGFIHTVRFGIDF